MTNFSTVNIEIFSHYEDSLTVSQMRENPCKFVKVTAFYFEHRNDRFFLADFDDDIKTTKETVVPLFNHVSSINISFIIITTTKASIR